MGGARRDLNASELCFNLYSRHGTCKLLYDTSLALARSSPTRRYTGNMQLGVHLHMRARITSYPSAYGKHLDELRWNLVYGHAQVYDST